MFLYFKLNCIKKTLFSKSIVENFYYLLLRIISGTIYTVVLTKFVIEMTKYKGQNILSK
ncbi:hypothetical protein GLOIN_2v1557484 [Rhizophagus irregularis DAOM 181602=DAOM 197198]|uniref:Uncharacterized protein n=1 Tax=Rhizophagus irregularis (strain DAOM 181602 / DAOM 197198 / MUCL 43194) TaxID=747089 RepID=A0A2P4QFH1_RHIID|nr:hypothetical protein GLOIN_2v1557484 [Rhizophagus irregularis DAOM 181602=DAOM 197198]POG76379.1 hypothetical protein GLOIN_2v1557484 [Rhizophagus irregularis DAOM 181602=DAOM 197198]|eukprot:XP_025183245.1 hypothetical protein GLOIN_2v1557484 [Rhizophagus irregularis DAOM 181602=DAOM 197198]